LLARMVWCAVNPELTITAMPAGWMHHEFEEETMIRCGERLGEMNELLEELLVRQTGGFCERFRKSVRVDLHPFEKAVVEEDLEHIAKAFPVEGQSWPTVVGDLTSR